MRTALVAVFGLALGTWTTSAFAHGGEGPASAGAAEPAPAPVAPPTPAATPAAPPAAGAHAAPAAAPAGAPGPHHGGAHGHGHHGHHGAQAGEGHHGDHAGHDGEHEEEEEGDHLTAGADVVFGFGRQEVGLERTFVTSVLLGAQYHFAPWFNLGLKWPVTVGSLAGETGRTAIGNVGNVEIGPEVELEIAHGLKLPIELGLALPTAGGDPFHPTDEGARRQAAINEIASATRGGEVSALFAAGRFGLVPRIALELERGPIEAGLYTKAELLFKSGGEDPSAALHLERKSPGVEWVTGASLFWRAVPNHFSIGTRAWVNYAAVEGATKTELPECAGPVTTDCTKAGAAPVEPSKVQAVLEPGVKFRSGAFRSSLGYILPLGGPLADKGYGGVRLALGAVY